MNREGCRIKGGYLSTFSIVILSISVAFAAAPAFVAASDLVIAVDGSGKMNGSLGGRDKAEIAASEISRFIDRNKGIFERIEFQVSSGDCDVQARVIPVKIDGEYKEYGNPFTNLRGKTDPGSSLNKVLLEYQDQDDTVLLISGGIEGCGADLCARVKDAVKSGSRAAVYAIGIGLVNVKDMEQLKCAASSTGGKYFSVSDANSMKEALEQIKGRSAHNLEIRVFKEKKTEVVEYERRAYSDSWACDVFKKGTKDKVATTNKFPARFSLQAGDYDVKINYGGGEKWLRGLTVKEGERITKTMNFAKGSVVVKVFKGDTEVIGVNRIPKLAWWCDVFQAGESDKREYTETFPVEFDLFTGKYDIKVNYNGQEKWLKGVSVEEGKTVRYNVRFN